MTPVVTPAEPSPLADLVKKGKRGKSGYSGIITFKELGKVSRSFRADKPAFAAPATDITYDLTYDGKGLPSRLSTSWEAAMLGSDRTYKVETRYRGWGTKVSIKPPLAAKLTR